jgi:hypothetical protein
MSILSAYDIILSMTVFETVIANAKNKLNNMKQIR